MFRLPIWLMWLGGAGTILSLAMGLGPLLGGGSLAMAWLFIGLPISVGHLVMGAVAFAVSQRRNGDPPGG